jgi:excisionase family DNA binding protein
MNTSRIRPKVYTVAEFAQAFAISPRLVRDLIHKGEIPALRIGRSYRIPRKVADVYLARALPPTLRPASKLRSRSEDDQTGFLFPIGTMQ